MRPRVASRLEHRNINRNRVNFLLDGEVPRRSRSVSLKEISKKFCCRIGEPLSRQPLVKGERLIRGEMGSAMPASAWSFLTNFVLLLNMSLCVNLWGSKPKFPAFFFFVYVGAPAIRTARPARAQAAAVRNFAADDFEKAS